MSDSEIEALAKILSAGGIIGTFIVGGLALFLYTIGADFAVSRAVLLTWTSISMVGWARDLCTCDDCQGKELTYIGMLLFLPFTVIALTAWVLIQIAYETSDFVYAENRDLDNKTEDGCSADHEQSSEV